MRWAEFQKAFSMVLWISPHVLLAVLAVIFYRRCLHREFPVFFVYVLYEIAVFLVLIMLYYSSGVNAEQYAYACSATQLFSIALRFGIIEELSKDLLCESRFLTNITRRSLFFFKVLLLITCGLIAVYVPVGNSIKLISSISAVNRGAAMIQCALLLYLLFLSHFLGLSWRRLSFGIALGLGILTSIDLAVYAVRPSVSNVLWMRLVNLLTTGTYLICVLTWIGYLLAPEPGTAVNIVSRDEVETWNRELQHLLRH